jgi:flavin reductase (DIM6/NTAB) family NADH-FMN oxidoreductase RutF
VPSAAGAYDHLVAQCDPAMVIVTVAVADARAGCLVGFHTQASIEPRRHLVLASRANHSYELLAMAPYVAVHLLGDHQRDLAELFGGETGDAIDKFAVCSWHEGPHGQPILAGVPGWFVGAVEARWPAGDHDALLVDPVAAEMGIAASPLRLGVAGAIEPGHPVR